MYMSILFVYGIKLHSFSCAKRGKDNGLASMLGGEEDGRGARATRPAKQQIEQTIRIRFNAK